MSYDPRDRQGGKAAPVVVSGYDPDLAMLKAQHVHLILSTPAGTVTKLDIPDWALYVKLYAPSYVVFFAVDEDPINGSDESGFDLNNFDLSRGDFLVPGFPEARVPKLGSSEIRFISETAGAEVYVSFLAGT